MFTFASKEKDRLRIERALCRRGMMGTCEFAGGAEILSKIKMIWRPVKFIFTAEEGAPRERKQALFDDKEGVLEKPK